MEANNKLRVALASILGIADHLQMRFEIPKLANQEISELKQIANTALAEPVRNYEVGTAEEQSERFDKFCGSRPCDHLCPARMSDDVCQTECVAKWAQMPYEEGGNE